MKRASMSWWNFNYLILFYTFAIFLSRHSEKMVRAREINISEESRWKERMYGKHMMKIR